MWSSGSSTHGTPNPSLPGLSRPLSSSLNNNQRASASPVPAAAQRGRSFSPPVVTVAPAAPMASHAAVVQTEEGRVEVVAVNIGGRGFVTLRSTLSQSGLFSSIFQRKAPCFHDEQGAIFIDRDGALFEPVLAYLRHGQVKLGGAVTPSVLYREALFYDVPRLVECLAGGTIPASCAAAFDIADPLAVLVRSHRVKVATYLDRLWHDNQQAVLHFVHAVLKDHPENRFSLIFHDETDASRAHHKAAQKSQSPGPSSSMNPGRRTSRGPALSIEKRIFAVPCPSTDTVTLDVIEGFVFAKLAQYGIRRVRDLTTTVAKETNMAFGAAEYQLGLQGADFV